MEEGHLLQGVGAPRPRRVASSLEGLLLIGNTVASRSDPAGLSLRNRTRKHALNVKETRLLLEMTPLACLSATEHANMFETSRKHGCVYKCPRWPVSPQQNTQTCLKLPGNKVASRSDPAGLSLRNRTRKHVLSVKETRLLLEVRPLACLSATEHANMFET